jgi:hypothetical protein
MSKTLIGIDNGVTGSIGIIYPDGTSAFIETPVFKELSYTKEKQWIHRIDTSELIFNLPPAMSAFILLERPMVNPQAFVASQSALRALEATLVAIERFGYKRGESFDYIDSKLWQRKYISSGVMGRDALKEASKNIGIAMFPNHRTKIEKHGDADGILIAAYLRDMQVG